MMMAAMMYDDDGHGCDLDDRFDDAFGDMICVEPIFHVRDDSYLDDRAI